MANKQKTELNEDQIMSYLKEIVEKIRTEEDPLELNEYRRLFRKAVPFTLRSYFAGYLLKQHFALKLPGRNGMAERNERSLRGNKKDRSETRPVRAEEPKRGKSGDSRRAEVRTNEGRSGEPRITEPRITEPRIVLADDVSTTLFLSIGRNRRVYPRDLIGLVMQKVEIEREHIGEIRVLDNYSFVQVITEDAEKIISRLNDFEYRGRKLSVSYSRKRDEEPLGGNPDSDGSSEEKQTDSWISETDVSDDEENKDDI